MSVTTVAVAIVVVVVVVAAVGWWFWNQQRKREELRQQFGPEYDHAVAAYGDRAPAEQALEARSQRVAALNIHQLQSEEAARYAELWRGVQTQFVDDPNRAIGEADRLCVDVMQARGYPMGDFEQRAADISVDHANVVDHYRSAHAIAERANRGDVSTEDLRQAMVHYRTLFDDLIGTREHARST